MSKRGRDACRSRHSLARKNGACRSRMTRALAQTRPIYAVWEITLACDLACRHCGSRAGRARPDELSTEECLDLVRQLAELGVREVTLIGGEAYLRADWLEIVAAIRAHGMTPTMRSAGAVSMQSERAARAKRVSRA